MIEKWNHACSAAELPEGEVIAVQVAGQEVALYRSGGEVFASSNICTHGYARLSDGFFDGSTIECPLHQGCFDVRSGKALCAPVSVDLRVFRTREVDGRIYIDVR
jgi:naphthalene 1,2-dioxygenase system ferredoxin subunit